MKLFALLDYILFFCPPETKKQSGLEFFCIFIHKISVFVCVQYPRCLPSYDKFKIGTCGKIFGNYIYMEFLNQLKVNFAGFVKKCIFLY